MYSGYEEVKDSGAFSEALSRLHGVDQSKVGDVKVDMAEEGSNLGDGMTSVIKVNKNVLYI